VVYCHAPLTCSGTFLGWPVATRHYNSLGFRLSHTTVVIGKDGVQYRYWRARDGSRSIFTCPKSACINPDNKFYCCRHCPDLTSCQVCTHSICSLIHGQGSQEVICLICIQKLAPWIQARIIRNRRLPREYSTHQPFIHCNTVVNERYSILLCL